MCCRVGSNPPEGNVASFIYIFREVRYSFLEGVLFVRSTGIFFSCERHAIMTMTAFRIACTDEFHIAGLFFGRSKSFESGRGSIELSRHSRTPHRLNRRRPKSAGVTNLGYRNRTGFIESDSKNFPQNENSRILLFDPSD